MSAESPSFVKTLTSYNRDSFQPYAQWGHVARGAVFRVVPPDELATHSPSQPASSPGWVLVEALDGSQRFLPDAVLGPSTEDEFILSIAETGGNTSLLASSRNAHSHPSHSPPPPLDGLGLLSLSTGGTHPPRRKLFCRRNCLSIL